MSVSVSGGSLDFQSTLDNSDFQAKSLQDIRLINERLKLTGDVSGINKYDEAVKSALAREAKLRSDLNKILDDARLKAQQLREEVEKPARLRFTAGDTAAELAAANAGLQGLANGDSILAALKTELSGVNAEVLSLAEQLQKEAISQAAYNARMTELAANHRALSAQIEKVTAAYSGDTVSINENTAAVQTNNKVTEQEIGLRENLIAQLKILKAQNLTITNTDELRRSNKLIQETEADLKRTTNAGKVGFDAMGNAVAKSTNFVGTAWGALRKLAYILPGIGVAGILAFVTGPIVNYIASLNLLNHQFTLYMQQLRNAVNLQNALNKVVIAASNAVDKELASTNELYRATQNKNLAVKDQIDAATQLQNLYPTTLGNFTTEAILAGKAADAYKELRKEILDVAYAKAISDKIGANSTRHLQDDLNITKEQTDQLRLQKLQRQLQARITTGVQQAGDISKDRAALLKAQDDYNASKKRENDLITDRILLDKEDLALETRMDELVAKRGAKVLTGGKAPVSKAQYDAIEGEKIAAETDLEIQREISQNQSKALADRQAALKKALDDQNLIILANQKQQLLNTNLTEQEKANIVAKSAQQKLAAEREYQKALQTLNKPKGKNEESADAAALRAKIALLQEVSATTASFNKKELNSDQAAIAEVTNRFEQLKAKIAAFNADPRHANHQITQQTLVDFQTAENNAIDNQQNLNENQYIQQDIEKKKKLYADYEAYKLKVGSTTADAEYQDLLLSGKNFETYLETIKDSIDKADVTAPIEARREEIDKQIEANTEAQKKAFTELLIDTATYEQKREAIIQVGSDRVTQLIKAGKTEQARQEAINTQESLDALADEQFKKLDAYKHLYTSIDVMSTASAQKEIAKLYTFAAVSLATGKISINAYNAMIKAASSFEKAATDKLPEGLKAIGAELQNIASEVGVFDEALGNVLRTAGSLVTAVGKITADYNTLTSKSKDVSVFDRVTSGLGIVGTAVGVITTVVGLFSNAKEKAEQLQYSNQLQIKQTEAINKALERQLQLTQQIYGPERLTAYLKQLADVQVAIDKQSEALAGKVLLTDNKQSNDLISSFNSDTINARWGKLIQQQVAAGKLLQLTGKETTEQLQNFIDNGKLDEKTAAIAQSLIDLRQQAIDTQNALNADLTGNSFDAIKSDIQSLFESSTTSAEDWANNFTKIIQKSVEKGFETKFLDTQLQGFYDDLAKFTKNDGGILSKDSIAKLQDEYNTIIKNAQTEAEQIKQQTGISINTPGTESTSSALNKSITQITSDQANALEGITRGQYDYTKKIYAAQTEIAAIAQKNVTIAMQGVKSWEAIQFNTAQTVVRLDSAIVELKNIVTNTKPVPGSLRGSGLG